MTSKVISDFKIGLVGFDYLHTHMALGTIFDPMTTDQIADLTIFPICSVLAISHNYLGMGRQRLPPENVLLRR